MPQDRDQTRAVPAAAVREQVQKILESGIFRSSERMSRFLRFVVERSLEGAAGEIKEYLLGVEIFDRSLSFDPRVDPIVRVEARRLRSKLNAYYASEGTGDDLVIELPTGGYVPRFRLRTSSAPKPSTKPEVTSIAVLPFANLSGDPDGDYFSDGLTEELINTLTKVEALRVVAWTSAAKFKDNQNDLQAISEKLGARIVLTGSVRRSGERLRITARLVDAAAGHYLWSEAYDRRLEDLFAVQQEISTAIVASFRGKLFGPPVERVAPGSAASVQAYDLYLRGRFHWNKRTAGEFRRAIHYFRKAVEVDPRCAPAYAGIADTYSLTADHGLAETSGVMPDAKAAAFRALELDPNLAEAHTSLALIHSLYEWNWGVAGEHYRKAIAINPGYVTARHWYGCDYLALLGRFDEAVAEMRTAVRLDPLSHVISESLAYVLMLARKYEEAFEERLRALELEPYFQKSHSALGRLYIHMGRLREAVQTLEKARALAGDVPNLLGALGQAHAYAGNTAEARILLSKLDDLSQSSYVPSTARAMIHIGLGEHARALDWLETACNRRELPLCAIAVHPGYDPLRGEPRFAALLARIGLAH